MCKYFIKLNFHFENKVDPLAIAAVAAYNVIFDDDDGEDEEEIINLYLANVREAEEHVKNENFFEETIPRYSLSGINIL